MPWEWNSRLRNTLGAPSAGQAQAGTPGSPGGGRDLDRKRRAASGGWVEESVLGPPPRSPLANEPFRATRVQGSIPGDNSRALIIFFIPCIAACPVLPPQSILQGAACGSPSPSGVGGSSAGFMIENQALRDTPVSSPCFSNLVTHTPLPEGLREL